MIIIIHNKIGVKYIYIHIYMCVHVCVCIFKISEIFLFIGDSNVKVMVRFTSIIKNKSLQKFLRGVKENL